MQLSCENDPLYQISMISILRGHFLMQQAWLRPYANRFFLIRSCIMIILIYTNLAELQMGHEQ